MARDMSKVEFQTACRRHGFRPGFFGYYQLPDTVAHVPAANAGPRRRDQLAYLIQQNQELSERLPKENE